MRFEHEDWAGAELRGVNLAGARLENVNLAGARLHEVVLLGARISGLIDGLTVNDVEVGPLIAAEFDRRYPERLALRPDDLAGVRAAQAVVLDLWERLRTRAEALDESVLHERVDGEWSLLETVRHLVFVHDAWIGRNVRGEAAPFHRFAQAPSFIPDPRPMGIDPDADPDRAEVWPVREERLAAFGDLIDGLAETDLHERRGEHTVLRCLRTVFDEEWAHQYYAHRDLDRIEAAG